MKQTDKIDDKTDKDTSYFNASVKVIFSIMDRVEDMKVVFRNIYVNYSQASAVDFMALAKTIFLSVPDSYGSKKSKVYSDNLIASFKICDEIIEEISKMLIGSKTIIRNYLRSNGYFDKVRKFKAESYSILTNTINYLNSSGMYLRQKETWDAMTKKSSFSKLLE